MDAERIQAGISGGATGALGIFIGATVLMGAGCVPSTPSPEPGKMEPAMSEASGLVFSVSMKIDAAGTRIEYEHHFANRSDRPWLLAYWAYPVVLLDAEPADAYRKEPEPQHPMASERHPPPTKKDVIFLAPGESASRAGWAWLDGYSEFSEQDGAYAYYHFKALSRVQLWFEYHGRKFEERFGLSPEAEWFTGKLKAEGVTVEFPGPQP